VKRVVHTTVLIRDCEGSKCYTVLVNVDTATRQLAF